MKKDDLLLYGGLAVAGYFLLIKPKAAAPALPAATVMPPVNNSGLASNVNLSSAIATQGNSLVQTIAKMFTPTQNQQLIVAPSNSAGNYQTPALPISAGSLVVGNPVSIQQPVFTDMGTSYMPQDDGSILRMFDPYGYDTGAGIDTSIVAGSKEAFLKGL